MTLRAPFPYFGGKSRVADVVWRAFGNCPNYVEPFFGSGAVLLGRPHEPKIETVNDIDVMIANFWRAVSRDPDRVAAVCDWPVNEADLHARHRWLVDALPGLRDRVRAEAECFDPEIAGWWVWGLSIWIGSGWCAEASADSPRRPHLSGQIPVLNGLGNGINAPTRLPSLGNARGVLGTRDGRWAEGAPRTAHGPPTLEWMMALQARLRRVRVCCGDWTRVLTNSVLGTTTSRNSGMNPCAVFLDPPYDSDRRSGGIYSADEDGIAARVADWAREHGDDPDLRIALCGYEGEHAMPLSWRVYAWKATRGYAGKDNANRSLERIWLSPHCLPLEDVQASLFEAAR